MAISTCSMIMEHFCSSYIQRLYSRSGSSLGDSQNEAMDGVLHQTILVRFSEMASNMGRYCFSDPAIDGMLRMSERGTYQELWMEDYGFSEFVGRVASLQEAISLHDSYCETGNWPIDCDAIIRTYSITTGLCVEEKPLFEEDHQND